jgi:hypothetical protein
VQLGTHTLVSHPETPPQVINGVYVEVEREGDGIWLRYTIEANPDFLSLPAPADAARTDGLWRTTCLEAFARDAAGEGYREFNFSPSSQWAAYQFTAYREGMANVPMPGGPEIGLDASDSHLALEACIPLDAGQHSLGLSAVIEELDGTKSYWALAHAPGRPDFHHPACFALELPAPSKA